jgi:hypothetical protein
MLQKAQMSGDEVVRRVWVASVLLLALLEVQLAV